MAGTDAGEKAEDSPMARRTRQGGKATRRTHRAPAPPQPSTPSPSRPAVSTRDSGPQSAPRSAAKVPSARGGGKSPDLSLRSAPVSSPDSLWRLPPVAESSRRNSADGQAASETLSWDAFMSSSVETVKREPLTPFPPWKNGDEGEGEAGAGTGAGAASPTEQQPQQQDLDQADVPRHCGNRLVGRRWLLNTVMHGVVLFGQCTVILAVLSVLVSMTVWKKGSTQARFWDTLCNYVGPALGLILAMCAGALVAHEMRVLSTVAVLYLQALILTATTATSLALCLCVFTQDTSQLVKGLVMGCGTMMMGTSVLSFSRTAMVWWMVEGRGELGGSGELFDEDQDAGYEVLAQAWDMGTRDQA